MRSVRGVGQWTDSDGGIRNAALEIEIDGGTASVTVSALDQAGRPLPTSDRRIAHFLGQVEQRIRAVEYAQRPITPDPKPKHRTRRHHASG